MVAEYVAEGADRLMGWLWSLGEKPEPASPRAAPARRVRPADHIESTLYTKFFDAP